MLQLDSEITYIKGVGPKRAEILQSELNIYTVGDILFYFPYKYQDRSRFYKISQIRDDVAVQIRGKFCCMKTEGTGKRKYLKAEFQDETGSIEIVWFKRIDWIKKDIKPDVEYIIFGKPSFFKNKYSIVHPEYETIENFNNRIKSPFTGEYSTTEKMKKFYLNSKTIAKIIREIFKLGFHIEETLPAYIIKKYNFPPIKEALKNIHFPQSVNKMQQAKQRFIYEELFINQLTLIKQKKLRNETVKGIRIASTGDFLNKFYNEKLPFELTDAQKRVIKEIYNDMRSGKQCNRLLQGDVGSGKTIVALMAMLIVVGNGYQAALMAPTEILARQHFENITEMLEGMNINIRLLTGSTRIKQRRIIDEELQNGQLQILIGTHALIEDKIQFHKLGLAIIDEQHRFGVVQRAKLRQKNKGIPPHIIVMSATPIPRTLSMTLYGDLDVSVIDQMPAGRKPVRTIHLREKQRGQLYSFLRKEIAKGRQVYIVYPLISESETLDYKNLEDGYIAIKEVFRPPQYTVAMVHGKMKPDEKKEQMDRFVSGEAQILVATTVVEVGVNVPNASVMVIESAERFGLSQLHQLRGRVGRGADQSYCILMTGDKLTSEARRRIETMERTNNGFEIAEVDMRLRGPGDMFGTQQSGIPLNFRVANLLTDGIVLKRARQDAIEILDKDSTLQNYPKLKEKIEYELKNSFGGVG